MVRGKDIENGKIRRRNPVSLANSLQGQKKEQIGGGRGGGHDEGRSETEEKRGGKAMGLI